MGRSAPKEVGTQTTEMAAGISRRELSVDASLGRTCCSTYVPICFRWSLYICLSFFGLHVGCGIPTADGVGLSFIFGCTMYRFPFAFRDMAFVFFGFIHRLQNSNCWRGGPFVFFGCTKRQWILPCVTHPLRANASSDGEPCNRNQHMACKLGGKYGFWVPRGS